MMRPVVPGIYIEPDRKKYEAIKINTDTLTGFVGLTERGPLNKPVRITSFAQFYHLFGGFTDSAYLPFSVYGFFQNGGKECVVVRIAHEEEKNEQASISTSSMEILDPFGSPAFRIEALSPGIWANHIVIKVQYANTDSFKVESLTSTDTHWAIKLDNSGSYEAGDYIYLRNQKDQDLYQIDFIEKNKIHLLKRANHPGYSSESDFVCEKVRLNVSVILNNKVEEYLYLSPNKNNPQFFANQINEKSSFVKINSIGDSTIPSEVNYRNLGGGRNGILSLTPADFIGYNKGLDRKRALGLLEGIEGLALICIPDLMVFQDTVHQNRSQALKDIFTVQKAMVDQCDLYANRFAILDFPELSDIQEIIKWNETFDSAYAAQYFGKIEITHPGDESTISTVMVPPSGHIAGIYAYYDSAEGVHRAPANRFIKGAVGVSHQVDDPLYEILYPRGVNTLKYIPGRGIKVWGARTLSSDPSWKFINVRRAFSKISEALKAGSGWIVFEPNNRNLQKRLIRHVTAFLLNLWREGYLVGATPMEAFYVRCDDELNFPEEIEAGRINAEIGIAISKPAEFLVIKMKADSENAGLIAEED